MIHTGFNYYAAGPLAQILEEPITDPVAIFLTILAIMLVAPLLVERLRLPGIIGLILAGVVVGPHGLGILDRDPTIVLLGTVGLLFLMFLGGLETSLDDLKKDADKPIIFGLATFLVPMLLGTGAMMSLGYGFWASVLVASCLASHTLVALPVLTKLGIMRHPSSIATLGGTLITNVLALLVLAVVVKADQGNLTLGFWLFLIPALTVYTVAVLWGVPKLGRWFFKKFGHDEGAEFTFVLATLFVASYLASLIEIEPIVGAFLAGVAITQIIPRLSPLMNRVQFIGNTLFVPIFLISVGMLVDPLILVREPQGLLIAVIIVVVELASKLVAAWASARWFNWSFPSAMVMFGLSMAQAASTLAAITIAFDIGLVDELVVNAIIAMILVSCVLSPWVVSRWGAQLQGEVAAEVSGGTEVAGEATLLALGKRVLIPVANPNTEDNLLQLAIILTQRTGGTLLPLHVLPDRNQPIAEAEKIRQGRLLETAETIAHAAAIPVETIGRIDDSIAWGVLRTIQERQADLLICGWKGFSTYRENFFGSVIDTIVRSATIPVLISRFPQPIENTERVLFAITGGRALGHIKSTLTVAQCLAEELKAPLQVIQMTTGSGRDRQLTALLQDTNIAVQPVQGNTVKRVSELVQPNTLLILIASTYSVGQPALGREPEAITRANWETNMIIVNFPAAIAKRA
ncbi:cation:proton antiporter [Nodosilinea sp. PGN35]|uniref:cation:proton antiporter domain-containing protein n=1 Tax=Nodosilinea sp. PGN35 TaxID=3020489 RepID=UPI0023B316AB|nr:cation:proton antiporter [Nodosilinea sp. TSF1-S3]MDF0365341.1 cation:proton antiporter [Nodosilinea sp. TSF1-S3]